MKMGIQEKIAADQVALQAAQDQLAADLAILDAAQPHLSVLGEIESYVEHLPEELHGEFSNLLARAKSLF
jgi:predicted  nucleic acid-binding Zn-ribbon protein